jgi:alginate O-acetyltransferase complex protein AlgI
MGRMLFNSPIFILAFLPLTLMAVALACRSVGASTGIAVLIAASLVFYGWWDVHALAAIGASIAINFAFANMLAGDRVKNRLLAMWIGISLNLAALAYFKYTNFFLSMLGERPLNIVLPLAISFYTFQQIAFLVDIYHRRMKSLTSRDYLVSVLFFPHLIAGPLIHYTDIMRQFRERFAVTAQTVATGLPLFCVGLVKKVAVADNLAAIATPLFKQAESGPVEFFSAWIAALSYTGQIYFDFSGYSDMALGLGLMFGIMLPLNFYSPYKSTSIIEFWRRWHMTLSAFLRDYLYIPLGGGQCGAARRYINLMLVMMIGGLWHGAGWTFVFWGFLHGVYLSINHLWRSLVGELQGRIFTYVAGALTFTAVMVAWVFFRASDFPTAARILAGMAGQSFFSLPGEIAHFINISKIIPLTGRGMSSTELVVAVLMLAIAFLVAFALPNTAQLFGLKGDPPAIILDFVAPRINWRSAIAIGLALWIAAFGVIGSAPSEFIYFQF